MKDDGREYMLLHTLHQLVYTRTGGFTCTKVITDILIGDRGHAMGSPAGHDQDKIRTIGLYSRSGTKTYDRMRYTGMCSVREDHRLR